MNIKRLNYLTSAVGAQIENTKNLFEILDNQYKTRENDISKDILLQSIRDLVKHVNDSLVEITGEFVPRNEVDCDSDMYPTHTFMVNELDSAFREEEENEEDDSED